jgi:hypothetical protein
MLAVASWSLQHFFWRVDADAGLSALGWGILNPGILDGSDS